MFQTITKSHTSPPQQLMNSKLQQQTGETSYQNSAPFDCCMQQDYCDRNCHTYNNNHQGLGLTFGCWIQLPWQMDNQSHTDKSRLVTEGLEALADQVSEDLKSNDVVILQRAIIICRDLLNGHSGSSKQLVVQALRDRGVVSLLIAPLLFRIDELNIITCQCLAQIINSDEDIQIIIDSQLIRNLTSAISFPNYLSAIIISVFLVLLQAKNQILQILISMERADVSNLLINLLTKMNDSDDSLQLLIVLQILLKRSQLAVGQVLSCGGVEGLCRWLGKVGGEDGVSGHFEIGFEIVEDLIRKHENLSSETKMEALEQMCKGGIVNRFAAILHDLSPFLQQIVYALSELCQVQGIAEVLTHLLNQNQYHLLIHIACKQTPASKNNQDLVRQASNILQCMLESHEGYLALRSLVQFHGVVPLINNPSLGTIILNKGCSQGGLALLQGLGSGQEADVTAAAEALAAMTLVQTTFCAPVLLHGKLVDHLISKFLSFFDNKNSNYLSDKVEIDDNKLIQIVLKLFSELPKSQTQLVKRSWSKTSAGQNNFSGEKISREGMLQSQNSSVSTISSLSQASIPREEVNIKRYDSATFLIGGKELYALGWVMEQHSPFIHKHFASLKDIKQEKITVPHISGMSNQRMYEVFQLAVEFAYTGQILSMSKSDVLPLWALSRQLQMSKLQDRCEDDICDELIFENEKNLFLILQWVFEGAQIADAGGCNKVLVLCMDGIAYRFEKLYLNDTLQYLLNKYPVQIQSGLAAHLRRRLQASIHNSDMA